ncbi:MAG: hypothetical protein KJ770_04890 [Actinobacteria bacterium]|nr:hypothetical protein [Actinomycetota bacterium]MCG2789452.1 hypothetical protein [Actinomycetes bacterium]
MNADKMVYRIDILDYGLMDLKNSIKWLIKTKFTPKQLDDIAKDLIKKKDKDTEFYAKDLASKMEKLGCFTIMEDLTDIVQHTFEYEI